MGKLLLALVGVAAAAAADERLPEAAKRQDRAAVRTLLEQGADVNAPQADGATALHWAVHWLDTELARLLIRARADVNVTNAYGVMPLSLAAANGDAATAAALLEAGANANAPLPSGETPLMSSAQRRS